jgi:hypothetical protein
VTKELTSIPPSRKKQESAENRIALESWRVYQALFGPIEDGRALMKDKPSEPQPKKQ